VQRGTDSTTPFLARSTRSFGEVVAKGRAVLGCSRRYTMAMRREARERTRVNEREYCLRLEPHRRGSRPHPAHPAQSTHEQSEYGQLAPAMAVLIPAASPNPFPNALQSRRRSSSTTPSGSSFRSSLGGKPVGPRYTSASSRRDGSAGGSAVDGSAISESGESSGSGGEYAFSATREELRDGTFYSITGWMHLGEMGRSDMEGPYRAMR
jgi:uncharacterized membrane protein YgcG